MKIGIVDNERAADLLRRVIRLAPEHSVIWTASNDSEIVEQCAREKPDLVLVNVHMSELDGVQATRRIMTMEPCAILIVTTEHQSDPGRVFEAMGYGALDAVDVPELGAGNLRAGAATLLKKIGAVSRRVRDANGNGRLQPDRAGHTSAHCRQLVAIGASAGGPAALATVLGGLPKDFPAAVVIIQHVDERFTDSITTWLGQHTGLQVRVAKEGDGLRSGRVLVAGTGGHLALTGACRLGYTTQPSPYLYRPSVDVFFHSVSRLWNGDAVGVLLTGMGKDGAVGLKALRDRGHHTIAQDEATSAVYGMPKAAAALNAAVETLPIDGIAPRLIKVFAGKTSSVAK